MMFTDRQGDEVLAIVASLKTRDVSQRHADHLRNQCHTELQARTRRNAAFRIVSGTAFRRFIGPAAGGAWSLAYLVEVIRRAAAAYGF
jgi:hypothetical protein